MPTMSGMPIKWNDNGDTEKNTQAILCYALMQNVNSQGGRDLIWPEVVVNLTR